MTKILIVAEVKNREIKNVYHTVYDIKISSLSTFHLGQGRTDPCLFCKSHKDKLQVQEHKDDYIMLDDDLDDMPQLISRDDIIPEID